MKKKTRKKKHSREHRDPFGKEEVINVSDLVASLPAVPKGIQCFRCHQDHLHDYVARQLKEANYVKCTCGIPWEEDMDQFGCWSCGALTPNTD